MESYTLTVVLDTSDVLETNDILDFASAVEKAATELPGKAGRLVHRCQVYSMNDSKL